ncbi:MAG: hypothetical protein VX654_12435, partial [Chloroflexota bacterium]|nr:hypothetical protein [Chloroflexota bacterium]
SGIIKVDFGHYGWGERHDLLGMPTNNEPGTQLCIRCGVHMDRDLPPQLVLESLFTHEFI